MSSGPGKHETVRPPDRWQDHKVFYAFVFVATAVLFFQWGQAKTDRSRARHTFAATSKVRCAAAEDSLAGDEPVAVDFSAAAAQIASPENLAWAVRCKCLLGRPTWEM